MAENNNLLKERAELVERIKKIQEEQGKEAAKLDETYIKLRERLSEVVKEFKDITANQRKTIQNIGKAVSSTQSLSSVYSNIKNEVKEQQRVQTSLVDSINDQLLGNKELSSRNLEQQSIVNDIVQKYQAQSELLTQLAQLSSDDIADKEELREQYEDISSEIRGQLETLDDRTAVAKEFRSIQDDIEGSLDRQGESAENLSSISQKDKNILEERAETYDSFVQKIQSAGDAIAASLSSPAAIVSTIFLGLSFVANKMGEVNKELGTGADLLSDMSLSTSAMSFFFEDAVGTTKALSSELGSTEEATLGMQMNIGLMTKTMGISNEEAVKLTGAFARLNGGSTDIATDMIKTTQEFAKQNNIIPSDLMSDLAESTEAFALFGEEGGKNILEAAGYARRLGTNMSTVAGIANNLLDFESSINAELELGALLGRRINLNRARSLAFEGKIQEATEETLNQLGGIAEFNRMNPIERQKTAELLGVSVGELQKMVQNEEKVGEMTSVVGQKFNAIAETLNAITNDYLGVGFKVLAGWSLVAGVMTGKFSKLGGVIKGAFSKIPGVGGLLGKAGGGAGGAAGGGLGGMLNSLKAGIAGLPKLLMSFANPKVILGLAAVTGAIIGLGFALKVAAPGIEAFGNAFGTIIESVGKAISTIVSGIGDFIQKISEIASPEVVSGIFGLAAGFGALTASLAGLSVVGLTAMPALVTIGAVGSLMGMGGEKGGEEDNPMKKLVGEVKGLRKDLNDGKVAVYIDGKKVTSAIATQVNKNSTNSYSL